MRRNYRLIIPIIIILGVAIFIDIAPGVQLGQAPRYFTTHLGLDLVGGVQALLEADVPASQAISQSDMNVAVQVVDNRVNGLGVSEAVVQQAGTRRIVVELPGETDPAKALATIQQTGLLEFIDMTALSRQDAASLLHTRVNTDWTADSSQPSPGITDGTPSSTPEPSPTPSGPVFHTVMTGADLKNVGVQTTQGGGYVVGFELNSEGTQVFKDFTSSHVGQILGIVLDKEVISIPAVNSPITTGKGVIEGNFTADSANNLAQLLRYGSLPIPLKVITSETVGPTLGKDSLQRSLIAGAIGMSVIVLFMAIYYRLPGLVADLALVSYALISYAIFRFGIPDASLHFNPVTLTLPGIAGFVLSVGMAVDANVLIFERIKEELRGGRQLQQAIDLGWKRAWPSIRDSNLSTLLTCLIIFIFGSAYGASIVKGFALTLGIGVLVSMFTAIVVTRTYLHIILDRINFTQHVRWFGI
jgi:preprotein translocase subunit SecD